MKWLSTNWVGVAFILGAWPVAPMFLARAVIGADWRSIRIAYVVWIALLAAFAALSYLGGTRLDESVGWPIILSLFLTILAVPLILVVLKVVGLR